MSALFDALRRGLDFSRDPRTYSIHPRPPMVGALHTFAPLHSAVLTTPSASPAPNTGGGYGQFGVLPKSRG